ncbi:MAG TPA: hypothetical protein VN455_10655 [Methanotrichaceae archaeon]|nr:hypothetical protein [Methanotrichaceae archaeon]
MTGILRTLYTIVYYGIKAAGLWLIREHWAEAARTAKATDGITSRLTASGKRARDIGKGISV